MVYLSLRATLPAGVSGSMSQQAGLIQKSTILLCTLRTHILFTATDRGIFHPWMLEKTREWCYRNSLSKP
jgi:hypothetical protein